MRIVSILCITLTCALLCVAASAQVAPPTINIVVDEWGHGSLNGTAVPWTIGQDPGPGGLSNALIYDFSSFNLNWTIGGLLMQEETGGQGEVVRFGQNGTLVFYSSLPEAGEQLSLADVGFPTDLYSNNVTRTLLGEGIFYVPTEGSNPGFVPGATQVEYHIFSSGVVPEPSSLLALLSGIGGLGGLIAKRRR